MKNLRSTIAVALVLSLVLLAACRKNSDQVKTEPITKEELLGHQITSVLELSAGALSVRLFHFTQSGDEIMATMDGVTSRRSRAIKVSDNRFTFDSDNDGKIIYTFNLKRNEKGEIVMDSYEYQNLNTPSIKMSSVQIMRNNFPGIKGKIFLESYNDNIRLQFTEDTWTLSDVPGATGSFYEIAPGAWKGNLNGVDYLGVSIADDKSPIVEMWLINGQSEKDARIFTPQ